MRACRRSHYYQLAKGLSVAGILGRPLSIAPPREPTIRDDIGSGLASEWCEWVERWTQTSTLETRSHTAERLQTDSASLLRDDRDR